MKKKIISNNTANNLFSNKFKFPAFEYLLHASQRNSCAYSVSRHTHDRQHKTVELFVTYHLKDDTQSVLLTCSSYRAVNTHHAGYKNLSMLYSFSGHVIINTLCVQKA
jgi:hypothetical protein